jgi:hypothetical protein
MGLGELIQAWDIFAVKDEKHAGNENYSIPHIYLAGIQLCRRLLISLDLSFRDDSSTDKSCQKIEA